MGVVPEVGNIIFYSTTSRYAESRLCLVTRFTGKSMFARIIKNDRTVYNNGDEVIVKNTFIVIPLPDDMIKKLKENLEDTLNRKSKV